MTPLEHIKGCLVVPSSNRTIRIIHDGKAEQSRTQRISRLNSPLIAESPVHVVLSDQFIVPQSIFMDSDEYDTSDDQASV